MRKMEMNLLATFIENKISRIKEMYSKEDWDKVVEFDRKDQIMAITHALCIGFANGVKWKRK